MFPFHRCRHSVESRTLTCSLKPSNLGAWSVLRWHPTHTHLKEKLSLFVKLFAFNYHWHAEWLGLSQLKRFSLMTSNRVYKTPSRRSRERIFAFVPRGACAPGSRRAKLLATVVTRVVTGISHWIVLFCERSWLAGVWCLCHVWWRTLFLMDCLGIELARVLCDMYLTRFGLTKGLLFDTFFFVVFKIVSWKGAQERPRHSARWLQAQNWSSRLTQGRNNSQRHERQSKVEIMITFELGQVRAGKSRGPHPASPPFRYAKKMARNVTFSSLICFLRTWWYRDKKNGVVRRRQAIEGTPAMDLQPGHVCVMRRMLV